MNSIARFAVAGGTLALALGLAAAPAAAGGNGGSNGSKNYTCTNQGGGPNHKVNCVGTVNGNSTTVNIGDVNVLSGDNLVVLQNALNNVSILSPDVNTQIDEIKTTVANFYLLNLHDVLDHSRIIVCAVGVCR